MSKDNPSIRSTIVTPTSNIKQPSTTQRLNGIENQLVPLRSIEMAGQGERVLQGRNTVIPGGASEPAPAPAPEPAPEPSGGGVPSGLAEETLDVVNNNNAAGQRVFLTKAV